MSQEVTDCPYLTGPRTAGLNSRKDAMVLRNDGREFTATNGQRGGRIERVGHNPGEYEARSASGMSGQIALPRASSRPPRRCRGGQNNCPRSSLL
jgi:hypothetical protein